MRCEPIILSGISEIAHQFDAFIFDVWGTLYDGKTTFPSVPKLFKELRASDKPRILLSNSPQIPSVVCSRLTALGMHQSWFDLIVTSGGETRISLFEQQTPEIAHFQGKVYQTGPERFPDTLPPGIFESVDEITKANWILNAGPNQPLDRLEDYEEVLVQAVSMGLPMLCANPDRLVFHGSEVHLCAGSIAERYSKLNGYVHSIGKPFPAVFNRCKNFLDSIPSSRILMIGDNIETDIKGANSVGLSSLLIASGVHQLKNVNGNVDLKRLNHLQKSLFGHSDYVISDLQW